MNNRMEHDLKQLTEMGFQFNKQENSDSCQFLLHGPSDTPYENGMFVIFVKYPKDYPFSPPTIRFITSIYHPCVSQNGDICTKCFDCISPEKWNCTFTTCEIIQDLIDFLKRDPVSNCVNRKCYKKIMKAHLFYKDNQKYIKEATSYTLKNATQKSL